MPAQAQAHIPVHKPPSTGASLTYQLLEGGAVINVASALIQECLDICLIPCAEISALSTPGQQQDDADKLGQDTVYLMSAALLCNHCVDKVGTEELPGCAYLHMCYVSCCFSTGRCFSTYQTRTSCC